MKNPAHSRPQRPGAVRLFSRAVEALMARHMERGERRDMVEVFGELHRRERRKGRLKALRAVVREGIGLLKLYWQERRELSGTPHANARRGAIRHWKGTLMEQMLKDAGFALRAFARRPGLAAVSVLTLALGIGAATTVFSLVHGVLLDPLPFPQGEEVYYVLETDPEGEAITVSYENFRDWQRESETLEALAAWVGNSIAVSGEERPERIRGIFVSASYFDVIGVRPAQGRAIREGEDVPGGERTAVISHGFWQRRFGADPGVLGRVVKFNNYEHTIVGIMPEGYFSPFEQAEAWVSLQTAPRDFNRDSHDFLLLGRLRDRVTKQQALDELRAIAGNIAQAHPEGHQDHGAALYSVKERIANSQSGFLYVLLAAVGMVLLIACANVANLQLAHASGRRREMAIRAAMGGGRMRLLRQLLTESLLLAAAGGIVGAALSFAGVRGMLALQPAYGVYFDVSVNAPVLAASLALTLLTGLLFGIAPALKGSRADPADGLREGGRGHGASRRSGRLRSVLAGAQMALAIMLLIAAGLLVRTLFQLTQVNPGFDTERLLTLEFRLHSNTYRSSEQVVSFYDRLLARVNSLPGAEGAALARALPFSGNGGSFPFLVEGTSQTPNEAIWVRENQVSPDYFEVMGIPLLEGRPFTAADRADSQPVAVISKRVADRFWPEESPLGMRFRWRDLEQLVTVVGVSGDVQVSLTEEPRFLVYLPYAQFPSHFTSLAVRTRSNDPMKLAPAVREVFWELDPNQPVWEVMPITQRIRNSEGERVFTFTLLLAFSCAALILASIGIYGVMGYAVSRRSHEIGVRMALGARRHQIMGMIMGQGLWVAAWGMLAGLAGAAALAQTLQSLLFGVEARDVATYLAAPLVLAAVAAAACYLPARRATRLDPTRTLQEE